MSPQKMRCNIYFNKDYHFFVSKTSLRKILWGLFLSRVRNVSIGFKMCRKVVFVLKKMIINTDVFLFISYATDDLSLKYCDK